jgi:hypothetical protein
MGKEDRVAICLAVAISLFPVSVPVSNAATMYSTSFESPEFNIGVLPQGEWAVVGDGSAEIQRDVVVEGTQALEIGASTVVDASLAGFFKDSVNVIWLDAWTQVTPQESFPDLEIVGSGSSLVHFNTNGISCLDGDGAGGGQWKNTGVSVSPGQWIKITIRQDYALQTWDCYVNGILNPDVKGLGFKDNISFLSGFKSASNPDSPSYLDLFRVSTVPPGFIYPSGRLSFFEFSTVWKETRPETPYVSDPSTFFKYYFSTDDNVSLDDLLYLIEKDVTQENETNFQ